MEDKYARERRVEARATHARVTAVKPGHRLQTAANAKKRTAKTPVGIFIALKVLTCLSNLSTIGTLSRFVM